MEPVEATINIVYVVYTKVNEVKEINDLFYVHFEGSRESIAFPVPAFSKGDEVKITFAKVSKCQPSTNTNPTNSPSS
jgi:hypothetical protein